MHRHSLAVLVLAAAQALGVRTAAAQPRKLAGIGDSISQGFSANGLPGDHPDQAFGQGTDSTVSSLYSRYLAKFPGFTKEFVSVTGAEMVGGTNSAAAQAQRICMQTSKPDRVYILLGGNDVCNRASNATDAVANMYSVMTYRNALKAAIDTLAGCLAPGSQVLVLSMPRVDFLYDAGNAKNSITCNSVWFLASVCRIVTGESNATRRAQIGARVDQYNAGLREEVRAADVRHSARGVRFLTDWQGPMSSRPATSVGTYRFTKDDISLDDCFHPYYNTGQKRLACAAWEASEYGSLGNINKTCLK
ncbi:MAG: GDSL-type esterase/lipase family protein [Polyangia bacterium]